MTQAHLLKRSASLLARDINLEKQYLTVCCNIRYTETNHRAKTEAPKAAQKLPEHPDINTTINIYAHTAMETKHPSARLVHKIAGEE